MSKKLHKLTTPRKNQLINDWLIANGLDTETKDLTTWALICEHFKLKLKKGQSAKDVLAKSIEGDRARQDGVEHINQREVQVAAPAINGRELTETWVDEAREMNQEVYDELLKNIRQDGVEHIGDDSLNALIYIIQQQVRKYFNDHRGTLAESFSPIMAEDMAKIAEKVIVDKFSTSSVAAVESEKQRMREVVAEYIVKRIEIKQGDQITPVEGLVHFQFEEILNVLAAGINLMLVGEAGAGKTKAVEQVAQALNKKFYCMSVGSQTTKSDLLGYMDANGIYRPSIFRTAFEQGGVFLLDEVDAGNANVITCLNAGLANDVCSFPDGMISKSADFLCVAAANTFGTGASRQYVGRNQLDAASIDRFAVIEFKYDHKLEKAISSNEAWVKRVHRIRKALKGERIIISPRASINGSKLLAQGIDEKKVIDMVICKGCNDDIREKIINA